MAEWYEEDEAEAGVESAEKMDFDARLRDMRVREEQASKDEESEEALPPIDTFNIDVTDSRGKRYQGTFTFRVPTLGDQVEIAKLKAEMLPNGSPADVNGALIVEMSAYLAVTLDKNRPKWFQPHRLYTIEPLSAVYGRCRQYEARFLKEERRAVDRRQDEDAASEGTASHGEDDVVGGVQPAAQRRETLAAHTARGASTSRRKRSSR